MFLFPTIIQDLLRLHHRIFCVFIQNARRHQLFWTLENHFQMFEVPPFPKNEVPYFPKRFFVFSKGRDVKNNISNGVPIIFLYSLKHLGNKKEVTRSIFCRLLEVPTMSQKVLQCPESLINHFGIIEHHTTPENI